MEFQPYRAGLGPATSAVSLRNEAVPAAGTWPGQGRGGGGFSRPTEAQGAQDGDVALLQLTARHQCCHPAQMSGTTAIPLGKPWHSKGEGSGSQTGPSCLMRCQEQTPDVLLPCSPSPEDGPPSPGHRSWHVLSCAGKRGSRSPALQGWGLDPAGAGCGKGTLGRNLCVSLEAEGMEGSCTGGTRSKNTKS